MERTNIENHGETAEFQVENNETGTFDYIHGLKKSVFYQRENQEHWKKYGFVEYQNQYWFGSITEKDDIRTLTFREVSNFIVRPLLLIQSTNDPKRIYELINCASEKSLKAFSPKEFTSVAGFCEQVEALGNYWLSANKYQFQKIKIKLYELCLSATEIKTLGYHPDGFYAFGNGIQASEWIPLDQDGYGIVQLKGKRYFLPALSKIYSSDDEEFQNHRLFIRQEPENPISFADYSRRFCEVYPTNGNGRIALLFYISCLFRDVVYSHFRFFPHLFLFGPPQSGKSSIAWSVMCLFGHSRKPFMLNAGTAVAFYKQFAEFQNAVVWFDEYQNSIDYQRIQSLKTAYDGAGHTKSENTKDNRNRSIPVKSGCVVSGQELPTADVALFTRCVLLQFSKTDYDQQEKEKHSRFKFDIEDRGISYLTAYLSQYREKFADQFLNHFDNEFRLIKQRFSGLGLDDRIAKNMAILLTTYTSLVPYLPFPFTVDEVRGTAYNIIETQNSMIASSQETSGFWKILAQLQSSGFIVQGRDFALEFLCEPRFSPKKGAEKINFNLCNTKYPNGQWVLFLRFNKVFAPYLKESRQMGVKSMDEGTLKSYLTNSKAFISPVSNYYFPQSGNNSCLSFSYSQLRDNIPDFAFSIDGTDNDSVF